MADISTSGRVINVVGQDIPATSDTVSPSLVFYSGYGTLNGQLGLVFGGVEDIKSDVTLGESWTTEVGSMEVVETDDRYVDGVAWFGGAEGNLSSTRPQDREFDIDISATVLGEEQTFRFHIVPTIPVGRLRDTAGSDTTTPDSQFAEDTTTDDFYFESETATLYFSNGTVIEVKIDRSSTQDINQTRPITATYTLVKNPMAPDIPNDASTTTTLSQDETLESTIDVEGDHDWIKIQLERGREYVIDLQGLGGTSDALKDPYLRLYNNTGSLVASNDDVGGSLNSQIKYTAETSAVFYIDAGASKDALVGAYSLRFSEAAVVTNVSAFETGISPSFSVSSLKDKTTFSLYYSLYGIYDEEAGYYLFSGQASLTVGDFQSYVSQPYDAPLTIDLPTTLAHNTVHHGSYSIVDDYDGTQIDVDFNFAIFDTAANFAGTAQKDIVVGSTENDILKGAEGDDILQGRYGNDVIEGGSGIDIMSGGVGDDAYLVDNAGDQVIEALGEGNDLVVSLVNYALAAGQEIETLQLARATGGRQIFLTGNEFAQILRGNSGANVLDGGGGADTLYGRAGDDVYAVDNAGDQVFEVRGEGNDLVVSTVSYALAVGQEIETLQLARATGGSQLFLTGNEFGQTLRGNAGANVLDGGGGADQLYGGAGDDVYAVDNGADRVFEAKGQGKDMLVTTVSYALAGGQEVEAMQFARATGAANLSLEGNEFDQTIIGNAGANKLNGGRGADTLTGRGGADTFIFATKLGPSNVDHITDFAPEDTIRLAKSIFTALGAGPLAESAFKVIDKARADADDRILYDSRSGELFYDTDGSGAAKATLFAVLDNKATLTAADILIV